MKTLYISFLIITFSTIASANDTFVCTNNSDERIVEVVYLGDGGVPCEVTYTKNGETRTLWSAQNETGYCETKAEAFLDKQESFGWSCSKADDMGEE